ncbi:MAG: hypothetical protein IPP40_12065 [bacterium]|nr:hypothetical protein [bacterium]
MGDTLGQEGAIVYEFATTFFGVLDLASDLTEALPCNGRWGTIHFAITMLLELITMVLSFGVKMVAFILRVDCFTAKILQVEFGLMKMSM